jgi:hypothetical protein
MSLIISITTREGIVMAADSRLTTNFVDTNYSNPDDPNERYRVSIPQSDAVRKLFVAHNRIGISTCGNAAIGSVPIAGFIESFIAGLSVNASVEDAAEALLQYFVNIDPTLVTYFHVAGYAGDDSNRQTELWWVSVSANQKFLTLARGQQDARWNGELDVLNRLFWPVYFKKSDGSYEAIFSPGVPMYFLTLQDAVDLAVFAMRTTIDLMRFQQRLRTVGGPIDVLTITPSGSQWLRRKALGIQ